MPASALGAAVKRIAVTVWSLAMYSGMSLAIGPPTNVDAAMAAGATIARATSAAMSASARVSARDACGRSGERRVVTDSGPFIPSSSLVACAIGAS